MAIRLFLSAGEPSGDLHAANLIRALRARAADIKCAGFGGPQMQAAGCKLLFPLTELALMWFLRVGLNLHRFAALVAQADRYLRRHRPDGVVLVDFPGFNWWIARRAHAQGVPVFYYVPPQLWAWAPWRVRKMRRLANHVLCSLPFEQAWYAQRGVPAVYVGHPCFDEIAAHQLDPQFLAQRLHPPASSPQPPHTAGFRVSGFATAGSEAPSLVEHSVAAAHVSHSASHLQPRASNPRAPALHSPLSTLPSAPALRPPPSALRRTQDSGLRTQDFVVGLLPGSRRQEVTANFPTMLQTARRLQEQLPSARFLVACFKEEHRTLARQMLAGSALPIELHVGKTPEIIHGSDVCLAVSGSVGLELLYHVRPSVVLYKVAPLALHIGRLFMRTRFISLVNLLADRELFPEYLTDRDESEAISQQLHDWLTDPDLYAVAISDLAELQQRVAQPGASFRAADYVLAQLARA